MVKDSTPCQRTIAPIKAVHDLFSLLLQKMAAGSAPDEDRRVDRQDVAKPNVEPGSQPKRAVNQRERPDWRKRK
jgi:hypothetical protein